jgi:hypothetical protein
MAREFQTIASLQLSAIRKLLTRAAHIWRWWAKKWMRGTHMADPAELKARSAMFEKRADDAKDPISRAHYRAMAAHYRALAVEHQPVRTDTPADH